MNNFFNLRLACADKVTILLAEAKQQLNNATILTMVKEDSKYFDSDTRAVIGDHEKLFEETSELLKSNTRALIEDHEKLFEETANLRIENSPLLVWESEWLSQKS